MAGKKKNNGSESADKFKDFDLDAAKTSFKDARELLDNAAHDLGEYAAHKGADVVIDDVTYRPAKVRDSERYTLRKLGDRDAL